MHGSARNWAGTGAVVLAIAVAGYLSFEFGRIQADFNVVDALDERKAYEGRIDTLNDEIVELKQEVELQKTNRVVDKAAYKEIETSLLSLESKIQEQSDAIAFYRGIISPADGGKGLRVQDLKLSRGAQERQFNLRLVLVQVKQHDRSVKGEVAISLDGDQDGVEKTYALEELLPPDADSSWPFAFRYFQNFDRQLILPVGFSPERINIEARSKTKSIASVNQSFAWHTGNSLE
jgi:hypothetical protein